jgi:hypothetical protein
VRAVGRPVSAERLDPEFDPRLVEDAVLEAVRGHPRARAFHAERDAVYPVADPESREAAFDALHARWFERLALDGPFREALAEQPAVAPRCGRWLVVRARARREEAADLLVAPAGRPSLLVRVLGQTVAVPQRLRLLLDRELLHVQDMLDPSFGYQPALPASVAGGPAERAVRDRYRVLWDVYADGRLARRGAVPASARRDREEEFARAFAHLGARAGAAFARVFGGLPLTHADLVALAMPGPSIPP